MKLHPSRYHKTTHRFPTRSPKSHLPTTTTNHHTACYQPNCSDHHFITVRTFLHHLLLRIFSEIDNVEFDAIIASMGPISGYMIKAKQACRDRAVSVKDARIGDWLLPVPFGSHWRGRYWGTRADKRSQEIMTCRSSDNLSVWWSGRLYSQSKLLSSTSTLMLHFIWFRELLYFLSGNYLVTSAAMTTFPAVAVKAPFNTLLRPKST